MVVFWEGKTFSLQNPPRMPLQILCIFKRLKPEYLKLQMWVETLWVVCFKPQNNPWKTSSFFTTTQRTSMHLSILVWHSLSLWHSKAWSLQLSIVVLIWRIHYGFLTNHRFRKDAQTSESVLSFGLKSIDFLPISKALLSADLGNRRLTCRTRPSLILLPFPFSFFATICLGVSPYSPRTSHLSHYDLNSAMVLQIALAFHPHNLACEKLKTKLSFIENGMSLFFVEKKQLVCVMLFIPLCETFYNFVDYSQNLGNKSIRIRHGNICIW